MTSKQFIIMRLESLFEILEARAIVHVYRLKEDGSNEQIKSGAVYEFLSDTEFFQKYGNDPIIGISRSLSTTSVLI